jgi:hypothetical protein
MLTLNKDKYLRNFTVDMTYAETGKHFGSIPLAEYVLMLGMEVYRERQGRTKEEVMTALWTYSDAVNSSFVPPPEIHMEVSRGLGDTIAKITSAVGIKPCGGCKERQEILNKLVPYGD